MDQMTPNPVPTPPVVPTAAPVSPPPNTVQTPDKSSLGWLVGGSIVVLAAIALGVWWWMSRSDQAYAPPAENGSLPVSESVATVTPAVEVTLTPGNSVEEIEQDLSAAQLQDTDSELQALEQDAAQVP